MLLHLLQEVIASQISRKSIYSHSLFSEIRIMDSSEFRVTKNLADSFPGYGGSGTDAVAQVQLEYELLTGKVTELSLGSALDSDVTAGRKHLDQIPSNALLLRDLGYNSPKVLEEISQRDIYFVSRAKAQWSMFIKHDGELKKLTIQDIRNKLTSQKEKYLDLEIFLGSKVLMPVRLIANLLTEEQRQVRIKKKRSKRGALSELAEESSGLNLFVTNIEKDKCSAKSVYELYTLRWQIELIFKTWKSILQLHKIHAMNAVRLECVILIKFIWVMLNWSILKLFEEISRKEISFHKFTRTMVDRSTTLNLSLLQDPELFYKWLMKLIKITRKHHEKEYKKGSILIGEILI